MASPEEWHDREVATIRADELMNKINNSSKYAVLRASDEIHQFLLDLKTEVTPGSYGLGSTSTQERLRRITLTFEKVLHVSNRDTYD